MQTGPAVKQFRVRFITPNHLTCELEHEDLSIVREGVQRVLNGGARFEPGQNEVIAIYHPTFDNGKTALALISPVWINEPMSNRALYEVLKQAA